MSVWIQTRRRYRPTCRPANRRPAGRRARSGRRPDRPRAGTHPTERAWCCRDPPSAEAHDVAVGVRVAVAVDRGVVAAAVGEREVDVLGVLVDRDPLGAVQARGAHRVGGLARADQHVGLVDPAVRDGEGPVPCTSGSQVPVPSAFELRDVERAVVERALAARALTCATAHRRRTCRGSRRSRRRRCRRPRGRGPR
jgi:hypothetical protein